MATFRNGLMGLVLTSCWPLSAQDSLVLRTNYYTVSGATAREIRAEIERKHRWKQAGDAFTTWKINWSFTTLPSESECRVQTLEIKTQVTMTLPQLTASSDADDALQERWSHYLKRLMAHEEGHKRIALAAASELRRRMRALQPTKTCEQLGVAIKREGSKVLDEFKQHEKSYDERTNHGRTEGAEFR